MKPAGQCNPSRLRPLGTLLYYSKFAEGFIFLPPPFMSMYGFELSPANVLPFINPRVSCGWLNKCFRPGSRLISRLAARF